MTEIFPPAAHLHVSPCPLTGNFALRATATHRWQSGSGGSGSHGGPGGSGGLSRPLQDPSPKAKLASELADAEEGHLLEADDGHLGDLAMMANGSCSTLSTLKSACAHSHQMAIAPCGRGFHSFLILNSYINSLPLYIIIIIMVFFRSHCVFMSRLVDRGRPQRQEIILNCVLQIQKYKVNSQYFSAHIKDVICQFSQCQTLSCENSEQQRGRI